VRYRFDVSSPVAVCEDLVVDGDSYKTKTSDTEDADGTFHCNTGNYILLMFGRLKVERAVADGRLSVEGSMERAKDFNAWFKGF
jgi:putative sterol carrier protein